jgi:hypothetical protein
MNNYLSLFTKTFEHDQVMKIDNCVLQARREDGYINAGKLCTLCDKKFSHWVENKRTIEFLTELQKCFKEQGITAPMYTTSRSENRHGTYVHPLVAINIAQWASPVFEVRIVSWVYQLFLTGSVNANSTMSLNELEQTRIKQLEHKITKLEQAYYNLEVKHERLKDKKSRHQFDRGNCFYIVRDLDCKYMVYKFGQTDDFTRRLSSLRTSCPRMTIERLIYIEDHIEFENKIKQYFKDNGHLKFQNHEFVEIPLEYVNNVIDKFLVDYEYAELPIHILDCINKKYLDCISDKDNKYIDLVFNHIQTNPNFNVIEYLEQCTSQINQIASQIDQHEQELEKLHQRISCNEPIYKPIISGKRITNITDMKLDDFEHDNPLKRRIRKSDFDFIITKIDELYPDKKSHEWFIRQFIFHTCYYTGVNPKKLLKMTYQNMIDFIHGKTVKIDDKHVLFTNEFIKDRLSFLIPCTPYLLPGGMVNIYGGQLTYRQLCKWVKLFFQQLEMKNFGKPMSGKDCYILLDFKTTFLYRLLISGMSTSDISVFAHHKHTSTTEHHLKHAQCIYNEDFTPISDND